MPGAKALVRTMKANGARAVLVSGGFTVFADEVARDIGFDRAIPNTLGPEGGRLSGTVARPVVDSAVKKATLLAEAEAARIPTDSTLDRKTVVWGKSVLVRVELGGRRPLKTKQIRNEQV